MTVINIINRAVEHSTQADSASLMYCLLETADISPSILLNCHC